MTTCSFHFFSLSISVSSHICVCPLQEQYQFLYDALESTFPVQNGEVKAVKSSAADSVQLVNETKAAEQPVEEMAASTTRNSQQEAAEGAPAAPEGGQETQLEDPNVSTGNGPTVTAEVWPEVKRASVWIRCL